MCARSTCVCRSKRSRMPLATLDPEVRAPPLRNLCVVPVLWLPIRCRRTSTPTWPGLVLPNVGFRFSASACYVPAARLFTRLRDHECRAGSGRWRRIAGHCHSARSRDNEEGLPNKTSSLPPAPSSVLMRYTRSVARCHRHVRVRRQGQQSLRMATYCATRSTRSPPGAASSWPPPSLLFPHS